LRAAASSAGGIISSRICCFTWVDEIVHHPAVLDGRDLIGPDILLFHLSVWPKNAHDPAYVSWHQDATYFGLEPPVQVTPGSR